MLVLRSHKAAPGLLRMRGQQTVEVRVQFEVVLVEVVEEIIRAQDLLVEW